MAFEGPYPTKFSGNTPAMVISATTFSGGVTNAGTIGAGGITVVSSTFLTAGLVDKGLIAAQQTGIDVAQGSTIHGAIVDSGTISGATRIGIFINGGLISGGIRVATHGIISAREAGIEVDSTTFSGGISNSGTISATGTDILAHDFSAFTGGIRNSGEIVANAYGIAITSFSAFGNSSLGGGITNSGTISVGRFGIFVENFSTFGNSFGGGITNTGTISAVLSAGIRVRNFLTFAGDIANDATLNAPTGIFIGNATRTHAFQSSFSGEIINSGKISATNSGIRIENVTSFSGKIVNGGTIAATNGMGILVAQYSLFSGSVSNAGTIRATNSKGILVSSFGFFGSSSVGGGITNSGTISAKVTDIEVHNFGTFSGSIRNGGKITAVSGNGILVSSFTVFGNSNSSVGGGIVNKGTISAGSNGILVLPPTFFGFNSNGSFDGGITNSGVIVATSGNGILVESAGTFGDNKAGGITNSGTISISVFSGGIGVFDVTKFSGGIVNGGMIDGPLAGGFSGIGVTSVASFFGGISNSGTITHFFNGIQVSEDPNFSGGIVNAANGFIHAEAHGIDINETSVAGDVSNRGKVAGSTAILVEGAHFAGNISNSGAITARFTGIKLSFEFDSDFVGNVINNGIISAPTGVAVRNDSILNGSIVDSGTIRATNHGILIDGGNEILASKTAIDIKGGSLTGGIANFGVVSGSVGIEVTGAHGVGVFDAGTIVGSGGTAVDLRTTANVFTLDAGYNIVGTVIGSGGNTFQLGGTDSGTFDLSAIGASAQYRGFTTFNVVGGTWTVSGAGSAWNVDGGTLVLASGGFLRSSTVRSGGTLAVLSGAQVSATTVSNGGTFLVSSGGTADPTRLLSGGAEIIASGGVDSSAQVSGGEQDVFGSASGTTVFSGLQIVEAGGIATSTTVKNRGTLEVQFGAIATGVVSSGGTLELVGSGTIAPGVTLSRGATFEFASGYINSGNVSAGTPVKVLAGGTQDGGAVLSGGVLDILAGGIVSGVTVDSGGVVDGIGIGTAGQLDINATVTNAGLIEGTTSPGLAISGSGLITNSGTIAALGSGALTQISGVTIADSTTKALILASGSGAQVELGGGVTISGGTLKTSAGGQITAIDGNTLSGVTVAAASLIDVTSHGLTIDSGTIGAGAVVEASGGFLVVSGTVTNGGTLFANDGSVTIANGAVVNGGVAEVGGSVVEIAGSSGESVKFFSTGGGGLALDGVGSAYSGKVSGFGGLGHSNHDQFIDFTAIGGGASVSYTSAASHTSGTLTVTSGGVSATVTLVGHYSLSNFSSSTVAGHVRITDPGIVGGGSVNTEAVKASIPHSGIDLPDVAFGAQTTLAYAENAAGTGGTLTVSDGRHAARIALLGTYVAGSFVTAANGNGGTLITEAQPHEQTLLAHPRAG